MDQVLHEILKLSEADRMTLVGAIWDSIGEDKPEKGLSEDQAILVKKRLDSYRANPENVLSWEDVKSNLKR